MKGWFRTSRKPTQGGTNVRTVALTAYEIASAMAYIHSQGVLHLVSNSRGVNLMLHGVACPPSRMCVYIDDSHQALCDMVEAHGYTSGVCLFWPGRS